MDQNGDGRLSMEEFEQAIRDRCSIKGDEPTPMHLPRGSEALGASLAAGPRLQLNWSKAGHPGDWWPFSSQADKDNDSEINFEEFLLWLGPEHSDFAVSDISSEGHGAPLLRGAGGS